MQTPIRKHWLLGRAYPTEKLAMANIRCGPIWVVVVVFGDPRSLRLFPGFFCGLFISFVFLLLFHPLLIDRSPKQFPTFGLDFLLIFLLIFSVSSFSLCSGSFVLSGSFVYYPSKERLLFSFNFTVSQVQRQDLDDFLTLRYKNCLG